MAAGTTSYQLPAEVSSVLHYLDLRPTLEYPHLAGEVGGARPADRSREQLPQSIGERGQIRERSSKHLPVRDPLASGAGARVLGPHVTRPRRGLLPGPLPTAPDVDSHDRQGNALFRRNHSLPAQVSSLLRASVCAHIWAIAGMSRRVDKPPEARGGTGHGALRALPFRMGPPQFYPRG